MLDNFKSLLQEFEALPQSVSSESIFNVAGFPHYENVCSNILAFYLNPNNEHGLGDLFLRSLLSIVEGAEHCLSNVRVSREVTTIKGGRIDLVIETDSQVVGIENKIYHEVNNDLSDYRETIDSIARQNGISNIVRIILGVRREIESYDFVSVTYEEYLSRLRMNLGNYVSTSSQKWVLYAIDFMDTIDNICGANMDINSIDQFFIENEGRIEDLINARNQFLSKLNKKVVDLMNAITPPTMCSKQWIYAKTCLVHDFIFDGNLVAFDFAQIKDKWVFMLFGRNNKSQAFIADMLSKGALGDNNFEIKDSRYVLSTFDLKSDNNEIIKEILPLMEMFRNNAGK